MTTQAPNLPDDVAACHAEILRLRAENKELFRKLGFARGALYELRNEAAEAAEKTAHPQPSTFDPNWAGTEQAEVARLRAWRSEAEWLLKQYIERLYDDPPDDNSHRLLCYARDLGFAIEDGYGV